MPNRLADETSPYLLQHKDNPVDWYPWGEEALRRARELDRPILLSVGYAACHWCHVMEHESFEDDATAEVMNANFVCVKVDREERPDIDAIYMEAVQAMTGHGGWPMTVFLTPEGVPFYGGTYFPPTDRHGMPSFTRLLSAITETWADRRAEVEEQGTKLVSHIGALTRAEASGDAIRPSLLEKAGRALAESFDPGYGGFSGAPKFPQPMNVDLALRLDVRGTTDTREMVAHTLSMMAAGGMYDQIGGGFARYSVDERWLVPHFEKMLYDNALLLRTYARAYRHLGTERYAEVARATATWLLREMRDPGGGFWSSLDADSEGVEGRFYVWDLDEVKQVTGDHFDVAVRVFGFTADGNFEGHNIPVFTGVTEDPETVERVRSSLLEARTGRIRPGTDDKVLAAWNGLVVSALCEASLLLGEREWIRVAEEAMEFVFATMVVEGRMKRSYRQGVVKHLAYAEDHAFVLEGCLALFEATGTPLWLERARWTADEAMRLFLDRDKGGFFTTGEDAEALITRAKDLMDNAVPSANSTLALELQRLALITGDDRYSEEAERILRLVAGFIERAPLAFGHALGAVDMFTGTPVELVLLSQPGTSDDILLAAAHDAYVPNKVIVRAQPGASFSPLLEARTALGGEPTAYVCRARTCKQPVTDPSSLRAQLESAV